MGKSVVYHEVIWRTKWRKGRWQITDIVKVSDKIILRNLKTFSFHLRFTCLIKFVVVVFIVRWMF